MKKKIVLYIATGLVMIISALYTYIPTPKYMLELTFMSNLAGGVLFLVEGILMYKGHKKLPNVLFLIVTTTLGFIFVFTVGCTLSGLAHFNFGGGMKFLHVINPIWTMIMYYVFHREDKFKISAIALSPMLVMVYLIFDYIRFNMVGEFVYGLVQADEMNLLMALEIAAGVYITLAIWGLVVYSCGLLISRVKKPNYNN